MRDAGTVLVAASVEHGVCRRPGRDLLRPVAAAGDTGEHRVLAVERRLIGDDDEELGAGAVAIARHEDG
jgi:hypothetical protein